MILRLLFCDVTRTEAIYTDMRKNFIFPQMEGDEVKFSNRMVHRNFPGTFQVAGWAS
jgi:hypothetical protein